MAVLLAGPGGALAAPAPQFHYGLDDSMRPGAFGAPGFQTQTPNEWGRPGAAPPDAVLYSRIFPERSGFGSSRDPAGRLPQCDDERSRRGRPHGHLARRRMPRGAGPELPPAGQPDQSRILLSRMHDRREMWYALGESNPSFQNENLAS